jgi:hypothetical protein
MTSLVAWVGVDSRRPASLYVATDSRVTWSNHTAAYDFARKTFAARNSPDIFGYVGDVLFPALLLPTAVELFDMDPRPDDFVVKRQDRFLAIVRGSWNAVPHHERRDVNIVHGTRSGSGTGASFGLQVLSYGQGTGWRQERIAMPAVSATLTFLGSGTAAQRESHGAWQSSDSANTSRAAFGAFCEGIEGKHDSRSGGAPQLVGLYREGNGRLFGISWLGRNHVSGAYVPQDLAQDLNRIEWRDRLFQRATATHEVLPGAQRHSQRG